MNDLEALLLGLVQGLTEFLPVSSSGHLVIGESLLGVETEGVVFEVAVHAATLVAILVFYRRRVGSLVVGVLAGRAWAWRYGAKLALGTLPAVGLVLLAGDWLESLFDAPVVAGISLLVTGGVLWTTRWTASGAALPEPGWGAALAIGCAQALAIVPGISRSGSTVATALALGVAPLAAAEFSFLLGVVAIAGATVRSLPELGALEPEALRPILLASGLALVSGLAALEIFVRVLRGKRFHRFALYTWPVGVAYLLWLALG